MTSTDELKELAGLLLLGRAEVSECLLKSIRDSYGGLTPDDLDRTAVLLTKTKRPLGTKVRNWLITQQRLSR